MAYLCRDCSYRGRSSSQSGGCPACGSFNVQMLDVPAEEMEPPAKWRIPVLISLWTLLLIMIAWKLVN